MLRLTTAAQLSFFSADFTPACLLREFIVEDCQLGCKKLPGVTDVLVDVQLKPRSRKLCLIAPAGVARILAVSSGKGGKSTAVVNVAVAPASSEPKSPIGCRYLWSHAPTMLVHLPRLWCGKVPGEVLEPAF